MICEDCKIVISDQTRSGRNLCSDCRAAGLPGRAEGGNMNESDSQTYDSGPAKEETTQQAKRIRELEADNARLRKIVRQHRIHRDTTFGINTCFECKQRWRADDPEDHAPDCPAKENES